MYKAVYKCRLCNSFVEFEVNSIEAKSMCDRITGVDAFTPEDNMRLIHKCKNGSRGIMDLQGFRFLEGR